MTHNTTPSYNKVDQRNRPCDPQIVISGTNGKYVIDRD